MWIKKAFLNVSSFAKLKTNEFHKKNKWSKTKILMVKKKIVAIGSFEFCEFEHVFTWMTLHISLCICTFIDIENLVKHLFTCLASFTKNIFYSQTSFTPNVFYSKHLLLPNIFCFKHLLLQTSFAHLMQQKHASSKKWEKIIFGIQLKRITNKKHEKLHIKS